MGAKPSPVFTVHNGDALEVLASMPDASIDAIVTDPPYELFFMGRTWDGTGIAYNTDLWQVCLRVLKPGGHLLSFGGTRTYHRMAVAIEDAGFEIRDSIHWTYGSGFPKSLNVAIAIDKQQGAMKHRGKRVSVAGNRNQGGEDIPNATSMPQHQGITPDAQQWQGWGTALKPSHEPIVLARKPLSGTVAANVLEHGTGALNIDGSRVGAVTTGRWPANTILTHASDCRATGETACAPGCPVVELDKQNGGASRYFTTNEWDEIDDIVPFLYQAKASKRERNAGLDGMPEKGRPLSISQWDAQTNGSGNTMGPSKPQQNFHPTVKPVALMRHLIRLVTPPGGVVLDPFTGSGTTGVAAIHEGVEFVGIERQAEYLPIITARLQHAVTVTCTPPQPELPLAS